MRNRLMTTGRIISLGGRGCALLLLGLLLLGCGSDNELAPEGPPGVGDPETSAQHTLTFFNNCDETIWVGMAGNALPGGGFFESGGWEMPSDPQGKAPYEIKITLGWQGRFWPRTGCTFEENGSCPCGVKNENPCMHPGPSCCDTGGCLGADNITFQLVCGSGQGGLAPASLFEFSFDADGGPIVGPYDTYDMSLVDGFNVPVQIKPKDGTYNTTPDPGQDSDFWCKVKGCKENPACPDLLKYKDNKSCLGPCLKATNDLGYSGNDKARICCDNSNITPTCDSGCADNCYIDGFGCSPFGPGDNQEKCYATTPKKHGYWGDDPLIGADALQYIDNVKLVCPTVYSWQFRDKDSTFTCRKTDGIVDYEITFCPSN